MKILDALFLFVKIDLVVAALEILRSKINGKRLTAVCDKTFAVRRSDVTRFAAN